ncbi:Ydc2-catalyt-domain-containing protein [Metschnikowia bicuspidata]|uniref:Ydc2-catalyt-domain-containing protein n=1 Tax=Metschnikowia bicuspidata TaxID=27322 RepID=A0A4P9ZDK8_9ASCO|nr:Ydc2-catalyt-domain-containing protein [Metschnikowia bicuspidata]
MSPLSALKTTTLNSFALHCGLATASTKAARVAAIAHLGQPFQHILGHSGDSLRVVSVDVGLKNFAYCRASYSGASAALHGWDVVNLHQKFGDASDALAADSVDSKVYLARLAVAVVDEILLAGDVPHVVTVESQRTRSNSNKVTLPNVLLNFSFEHMLYAVLAARQSRNASLAPITVVPMNSKKMVNFWLARYVEMKRLKPAQSKGLRTALLYSWLLHNEYCPFDMTSLLRQIPPEFGLLAASRKVRVLTETLRLESVPKKVDDMVDSFLYNMAIAKHIQRYQEILECERTTLAYQSLIETWDRQHCRYLTAFLSDTGSQPSSAYSAITKTDIKS